MKTVYLAGPITGCTYGECTNWRVGVREELKKDNIIAFSPMRAKEYLAQLKTISGTGKEYFDLGPISTPRGVITRDRFDTQRVDMVLVNLLGAKSVSIGTMIELGWADSARRPIVCVIEPNGNPHEHMMVAQLIDYRVATLAEAVYICKAVLLP